MKAHYESIKHPNVSSLKGKARIIFSFYCVNRSPGKDKRSSDFFAEYYTGYIDFNGGIFHQIQLDVSYVWPTIDSPTCQQDKFYTGFGLFKELFEENKIYTLMAFKRPNIVVAYIQKSYFCFSCQNEIALHRNPLFKCESPYLMR